MIEPIVKKKIKVEGIRKIIGDKMRESITQHPQGTLWNRIVMDNLLNYKDELKQQSSDVTVTGMIIKAVSNSLLKYPEINAALLGDEIAIYENVNIGVAVEVAGNLFIVVIRDTQDKDVFEISKNLKELIEKLKTNTISMDDFMGATFVLSNLGMFDLDGFTPLINPPLTGVLGVGATRKEVVVDHDDTFAIKKKAEFTFTLNHASADGAPGARFFQEFKRTIENIKQEI